VLLTGRENRRGNGGAVESMENQTPVSHTSPDSLEIPQTPPDFHIPTAPADPLFLPIQSQNKRKEVGRCAASSSRSFHDHYALESKNGFMIIPGLENAATEGFCRSPDSIRTPGLHTLGLALDVRMIMLVIMVLWKPESKLTAASVH
jgi:hypothetical protein